MVAFDDGLFIKRVRDIQKAGDFGKFELRVFAKALRLHDVYPVVIKVIQKSRDLIIIPACLNVIRLWVLDRL